MSCGDLWVAVIASAIEDGDKEFFYSDGFKNICNCLMIDYKVILESSKIQKFLASKNSVNIDSMKKWTEVWLHYDDIITQRKKGVKQRVLAEKYNCPLHLIKHICKKELDKHRK